MKECVVAIGEVLWDIFPDKMRLGGAPLNFAWYAREFGADSWIVSSIGADINGEMAERQLNSLNISRKYVNVGMYPTGSVEITLDEKSVPQYRFAEDCAWDYLTSNEKTKKLLRQADVVYFGTLIQRSERSRETLYEYLSLVPKSGLRVFDMNLREDYFSEEILHKSLERANILKVSLEELPIAASIMGIQGDAEDVCQYWLMRYNLRLLVLTCGAEGSVIMTQGERVAHDAADVEVIDTGGAGDSFLAAVVMGYLHGWTIDEIGERANVIATYVCQNSGSMVSLPQG